MTGLDVKWALELPQDGTLAACNCWGGDAALTHDGVAYSTATLTGPSTLEDVLGEPERSIDLSIGSTTAIRDRLLGDTGKKFATARMLWRLKTSTGDWTTARTYRGLISGVKVAGADLALTIDLGLNLAAAQKPAIWSDQAQRSSNPGDRFFEHLGALAQGSPVAWPV